MLQFTVAATKNEEPTLANEIGDRHRQERKPLLVQSCLVIKAIKGYTFQLSLLGHLNTQMPAS